MSNNVIALDPNVVFYAETIGGKDRFKIVCKGDYYHVQFTTSPHGPGDWWFDSYAGEDAARRMVPEYMRNEKRELRVVINTFGVVLP